jgi:hypothetical protein
MMQQPLKTALELLADAGIITNDMMEAGHLYAEICYLNPAGGPAFSSSFDSLGSSTYDKKQAKNMEQVWRELHQLLKQSPISDAIERLTVENDADLLPWVYEDKSAQHFLKETLENLVFCLRGHGRL